uniref:Uncharacterized protein n=1 Tax=Arundo donax TaxID=35708 RepID=A0A0A9CLI0_ARUDO
MADQASPSSHSPVVAPTACTPAASRPRASAAARPPRTAKHRPGRSRRPWTPGSSSLFDSQHGSRMTGSSPLFDSHTRQPNWCSWLRPRASWCSGLPVEASLALQ